MSKGEKIRLIILVSIIASVISSISVFAASSYFYMGADIGYDNSQSGLESDNVQGAIDDLREKATNYNEIRAMIYPVGSIYMSVTDDTVAKVQERFGGTWQKIEGRFLLSSSGTYKVNNTGGSADAVVVSHTHSVSGTAASAGAHTHSVTTSAKNNVAGTTSAGAHTHSLAVVNGKSNVVVGGEGGLGISGITSGNPWGSYGAAHWLTGVFYAASAGAHSHNLNIPALSGTAASAGAHTHSVSGTAAASGVSGSGKNMPPYYVVHVYKRTA